MSSNHYTKLDGTECLISLLYFLPRNRLIQPTRTF
nr:MAG TPA: hypothetical protein [Caudoviricetes sp.]